MNRETYFAEHPMFKRAASSVKRSKSDCLKNLLEFRENFLFVWSSADNALLVTDVNSTEQNYQTLRLLTAPCFGVERVLVSAGCARACVWGARGVVVADLPHRLRAAGDTPVLCKSVSLDERFLLSQAEVRRVRWHPDSLSHLLVLVSDNTIRIYNVAAKSQSKLVKSISIGPKPTSRFAGRPILESLGDTAVDFDVAPGGGSLLLLRGNGDVYTVGIDSGEESKVRGPLAMYPPADDNYGSDSCSILVLAGRDAGPPLVVIATSSALLYHCLLLPDANYDDLNKTQASSELALFVVECVELNIVLGSEDESLQYSYPVHLYPIANKSDRYACVHAAGVHTVALPVMSIMKEYVDADNSETEAVLSRLLARASVARYLVCTHAPGAGFEPVLGASLVPAAALASLLVLLRDGRVVVRNLEPLNLEEQLCSSLQQEAPDPTFQRVYSLLKEREKMSFSSIIQDILTRGVSQPILKMSVKEEPSPKEAIELLAQATMKLSSEYMMRQERASEVIRYKLSDMSSLGEMQAAWLKQLQVQAEEVTSGSVALRERCAAALERQRRLQERCWGVMRDLRSDSALSTAEGELLSELRGLRAEAETCREEMDLLAEFTRDNTALKKLQEESKRNEVLLGRSHSDTISSVIETQSAQLSSLIEDTKLLKDQLSIA